MNSVLQALSACTLLTRYFLGGRYEEDLNRDNTVGTGGKLAEAYAALMKRIWHAPARTRCVAIVCMFLHPR